MTGDDHEKVRQKAHELWEAEGRPEGRADLHWTQAREIVALKDGAAESATTPLEETVAEPVEPAIAVESHGDVPGLTDLGETGEGAPSRARSPGERRP